jgi:hypothetical protein
MTSWKPLQRASSTSSQDFVSKGEKGTNVDSKVFTKAYRLKNETK